MDRTRWLITAALALTPMLGSMALQPPASSVMPGARPILLSAAGFGSGAKEASKSSSKSSNTSSSNTANTAGNSTSNSTTSNSGSSSTSSTGSASNSGNSSTTSSDAKPGSAATSAAGVAVSVPQAKVTNPHGPLNTPCANCHTYTSWKPIRSNPEFNHDLTGYPLRGMHENVACTKCHTSLIFKNVSTQCADCHADIHRRQFGANCESCHSVKGWNVSMDAIKNHQNRFPLTGAHALVECEECHKNAASGQFAGLSTACYTCHQQDFRTPVVNHVGLGFPTTCESCHSVDSWFNAKFDHLKYTGYALTGAHATLECTACHINNVFAGTPASCYGCHSADYTNSNNPPHVQLGLPRDCSTCHTTTDWLNAKFDHALYAHYPLTGGHANVGCQQCHANNSYVNTSTACYTCHKADYNGATNPNHVQAGFPTTCETCHTITVWTTATFNHNTTSFPLTGAHTTVPCAQCHVNGNYAGTLPTNCYGCHQADYKGATNPNHVSANFPTACETCHTTTSWNGANFNHNNTPFPLTGAHVSVPCASCHVNNVFAGTPTDCYACHTKDFTGTTNPNHVSSGFPTSCTLCHNTAAWSPSTFNHASVFPLTGAHATLACAQCHTNNNYTTVATDCYSCHKADYNGTTNPNHVTAGFPTACATCHNTSSWTGAVFNHNNTPFPLTGAHVNVPCASCHVNNVFAGTPTDCYSCHTKDFTGTTNPNHVSSGFPTNCSLCHNTTAWTPSTFNHSSVFPLTGAHATTACAACHTNNNYTTLPTNCYGCHQTDYNNTNNPPHLASSFPTTCDTCHSTTSWAGAVFDHNKTTFPLTGAHVSVPCASCHTNNNYTTLPTNCYGCHQADFTGTTNPAHVAGGFPTDCTLCHSTTNWTTSTFNHASVFPLVGFHATVACASCHTNNNYTTLPTNCYGCHQKDFTGTTNPSHVAASFPTTCDTCHTQNDWTITGMNFNHTLYANYALTGFHATLTCVQCHTGGTYTNLSTACYSCHQSDFTGTTNPAHVTAGFPTDCSICHSTSNWTSSTFNHSTTSFPLVGFHATMQCVGCHTSATTYNGSLPTTCIGCHQADYNGTTNPAHAAAGFPTTCDTCHNMNNWTGATFNHANTPFPLTGAHTSVACNLCHINNVFAGTPTDCYSCHTADYTGTTNPNHTTAGWPTTCVTCHTTTAWIPATLPTSYHTFFPTTHGNANSVCATCHTNSSDYSVFQCTGCHGGNNAANFNHPNVNGYVYNSVNCYACHKSGGGG